MSFKLILLAGVGSFTGGVMRYLVSLLFQQKSDSAFPWSTFLVNITGCFLMGLLYGFAQRSTISGPSLVFLGTGVLGGFTTFSAFSNETVVLLQGHHYTSAVTYVLTSMLIGIALTCLGWMLAKMI
jgi:CrcB protein